MYFIHPFTKRLTFQIYIYLLFLWAKQKKKQKVYLLIYISEIYIYNYIQKAHKEDWRKKAKNVT